MLQIAQALQKTNAWKEKNWSQGRLSGGWGGGQLQGAKTAELLRQIRGFQLGRLSIKGQDDLYNVQLPTRETQHKK